MINLVMFHSGKGLPVFLEHTFKQIRLFNPDITIHFITDYAWLGDPVFDKYEIRSINKDLYYTDKVKQFEDMYNYPPGSFWVVTTTRFMYIEKFLEMDRRGSVYHLENDILLYYDLEKYHEKFVDLFDMAITPGGPDRNITGFMFIKNWESLSKMTQFFIDIIKTYGLKKLREKYNTDMVHEMSLMKMYEIERGQLYLTHLPTLPFGEHAGGYDIFDSIFDPAAWGQFVGGTNEAPPGAKPNNLYIGQLLIDNPDYTVIWKKDSEGRKIPYFKYNDNHKDNEIKINNLHIHSKNLSKYVS